MRLDSSPDYLRKPRMSLRIQPSGFLGVEHDELRPDLRDDRSNSLQGNSLLQARRCDQRRRGALSIPQDH